jgi:uracil-DNA glycosylase family 4
MPEGKYVGLDELNQELRRCHRCSLALTRKQVVCGFGCKDALVFLAGEAPGGEEDLSGKPFTGRAGKELDEFLNILSMNRDEIYIGNTVKCRPTRPSSRGRYGKYVNRKPTVQEIKACAPWLDEEIRLINPKVIVTLGGVPLSRVFGKTVKVGDFRGKVFYSQRYGCYVFPLYHPASVIYDRNKRSLYLDDLANLKDFLQCQRL